MDGIINAAKQMDSTLYGDLLDKERDYRVELNAILFPKQPFQDFMGSVNECRNAIVVWMKLANGVTDESTSREFRKLVMASANSLNKVRDDFVKWLSQRQQLIDQARRELRG